MGKLPVLFSRTNRCFNRSDRREFKREYNAVSERFIKIVESFEFMLFDENDYSYNQLYQEHLDWFLKTFEEMESVFRLKYMEVNRYFFAQMYKPIEKVPYKKIFH